MNGDGFAFVVGGGSGIGKACALGFSKEGARGVMVADIDLEAAQAVAIACKAAATNSSAGFRAEAIHMDVTKEESVKRATALTVEIFGHIDYCATNAGIGIEHLTKIDSADAAEFDHFLSVNVTGTFLVTREVSAVMKTQEPRLVNAAFPEQGGGRGAIVNLGSLSSFIAQPGMTQYTASKHAVLGISKNAALDNVSYGIRVNCVCPSWVDTPMVRRAVEKIPGYMEMITDIVPFGRTARPEEVADTVIFLCSPRSSYITGSSLIIDGGTSLRIMI
ncbi:NAD(P)-binding protein [Biscogniauxia sp. FL1348]|nr:NAD(P)-binding protein [Biscogniauxia sp. FL1348]